MSTKQDAGAVRRLQDGRSSAVVSALVTAGLLDPARRDEAAAVVDRSLHGEAATAPLRRRMAEVAGYVGGAFVVAAAVLFVATEWSGMTLATQVGLLLGTAAVLAVVAVVLAMTGGGFAALRTPAQSVRRRLAGLLFTGAAGALAMTAGILVADASERPESGPVAAGFGVLAIGSLIGYLLVPTVLGQVAVAGSLVFFVPAGLDLVGDVSAVAMGLILLGIGVVWLLLAEAGAWRELWSARVIGSVLAVVGAQIPAFSSHPWVGYLATIVVAGVAFAAYVTRRAWPYLAVGVVGVTLAVPEALLDWTEGSLGSAGVLLVAGVTLLGASLLGLRLRQEVTEGDYDDRTVSSR